MSNRPFDFSHRVSEHDREIAHNYIGSLYRPPDLVIAPEGHGEYLFRWYVAHRNRQGNVYFHVQTASDPERPLHDHPWDNTSVILSGGYDEIICMEPDNSECPTVTVQRRAGDVIHRPATWGHRLILPEGFKYTMTLFVTGPKVREWGFWHNQEFTPYQDVTVLEDGKSKWKEPTNG